MCMLFESKWSIPASRSTIRRSLQSVGTFTQHLRHRYQATRAHALATMGARRDGLLSSSARRVTLPSTRDEKAAIAGSRARSPGWWMRGKRLRYRGELSEADVGRPLSRYAGEGKPSIDSILFEAPKGCPIYKQLLGSFFLPNRSTSPLLILHINKTSILPGYAPGYVGLYYYSANMTKYLFRHNALGL